MKKRKIVERVAKDSGVKEQAVETAIGTAFASIAEALARGEEVTVTGFGRFARTDRPAREGRKPMAGEAVSVSASTSPAFKAGKALKDAASDGGVCATPLFQFDGLSFGTADEGTDFDLGGISIQQR